MWTTVRRRRPELDVISAAAKTAKKHHKKAAIRGTSQGGDIFSVDNHGAGTALQLAEDWKTWLYWNAKGPQERLVQQLMAEGVPMREAATSLKSGPQGGYDYGVQVEAPPNTVLQGWRQGHLQV